MILLFSRRFLHLSEINQTTELYMSAINAALGKCAAILLFASSMPLDIQAGYPATTSYSPFFLIQMIIETTLQENLPASLKKKCDEIKDIAFYYEGYIESLIEHGDFSFKHYLEMEGRDDLSKLHTKIESAEIYVTYSINTFFSKYMEPVSEQTIQSGGDWAVLT